MSRCLGVTVNSSRICSLRRAFPTPCAQKTGATESPIEENKTPAGTIFYGGKTYTDEEWSQVLQNGGARALASETSSGAAGSNANSFGDIMAFAGPAPEIINGRLAMLGFVSAAAAEFRSEESVLQQLAQEPTLICLTFVIFIAGSLVPLLSNTKDTLGPFTPQAEMLNGRAAMIGFAAMLVLEAVNSKPLF